MIRHFLAYSFLLCSDVKMVYLLSVYAVHGYLATFAVLRFWNSVFQWKEPDCTWTTFLTKMQKLQEKGLTLWSSVSLTILVKWLRTRETKLVPGIADGLGQGRMLLQKFVITEGKMYSKTPLNGLTLFFYLCVFLGKELWQLSITWLSFWKLAWSRAREDAGWDQ